MCGSGPGLGERGVGAGWSAEELRAGNKVSKALRMASEPWAGCVREMWCVGEGSWFLRAGGKETNASARLSPSPGTRELSPGVPLQIKKHKQTKNQTQNRKHQKVSGDVTAGQLLAFAQK